MTRENLELREWLAVNLMGLKRVEWRHGILLHEPPPDAAIMGIEVPPYESTWEGMGLVVEAMRARGYALDLRVFDLSPNTIPSRARFEGDGPSGDWFSHQHAPMAVALAARAALEGGK